MFYFNMLEEISSKVHGYLFKSQKMLSTLKRIIQEHVNRIILEIHYEDLYPPEFVEFRKKYLALAKSFKGHNLYVQFTDHAPTKRHKKAFEKPDHSDFVGIYGYPLAYVLNYPADIWYGRNAARLRLLEDTSQNILSLNYMTWREAENAVYKLGFHASLLELARKNYKHKGSTMAGKCFLSVLQFKLEDPPTEDNSGRMMGKEPGYAPRSGREQTQLLLKLGYDCVKDSSSNNKQAVINSREPEQICFLTKSSFKVLEIVNFTLPETDENYRSLASGIQTHKDNERMFAEKIFNGLEDTMRGVPRDNRSHIYFSEKGRQLEIDFNEFDRYRAGWKMGEKKHRFDKLHTKDTIIIKIQSERGEIVYRSHPSQKVKDVVLAVRREVYDREEIPGWVPLSYANHEEKKKAALAEKYKQDQIKKAPRFLEDVSQLASALRLPWSDMGPVEEHWQKYGTMELIANFFHRKMDDAPEDFDVAWERITDQLVVDISHSSFPQLKQILRQYTLRFKDNAEIARLSTFGAGSYWAIKAIKERDGDPQEQS